MKNAQIEHGLTPLNCPENERVLTYAPGSPERAAIVDEIRCMSAYRAELPLWIDGKAVTTGRISPAVMPHAHKHVLADVHQAGPQEIQTAIDAACRTAHEWSRVDWKTRASIFLKAADLLAGPWRKKLNAATMLGQSKTVHQAEIDSAAELIDFWRFNVAYMHRIYSEQPVSISGAWNRTDYRPLEGFVFAVTPFNFTAIAGNLPTAPALMGNTVVWKAASTAMYSAHLIIELLKEAGLPDGVINLVYGNGSEIGEVVLSDPRLAGVHFTGSTGVFNDIVRRVGDRTGLYRGYPRVVGETGGKNFILAHASADVDELATAITRGGFEYQGQKCSAASRIFVPQSLWPRIKERVCADIAAIRMGDVSDFRNFVGAVIDDKAWSRLSNAISTARAAPNTRIVAGGAVSREVGYFVHPTLIETSDLESPLLHDELFGPIVTAYVYPDAAFPDMARGIEESSRYALTGAIFARDPDMVALASNELRFAAGNFYINDKPTGAVVGQQPFGGGRASGTNDKAGSMWNLMRWVSPRSVKESFSAARDFRYPFMQAS